MLSKLHQFFNQYLSDKTENPGSHEHRLQLACAALMVEMLYVDEKITDTEENKIRQLIKQRFELNASEIESLLELAHNKKHEATDYYEFTALLNTHFTQQQKIKLVKDLWRLAFADGELDKHEEHLLRRLCDLLHVPHHDFIRTKYETLKQLDD